MVKPIKCIWGVNNRLILTINKNTPITSTQKTITAVKNKPTNIFCIDLLLIPIVFYLK